jgi:hypothetical protein
MNVLSFTCGEISEICAHCQALLLKEVKRRGHKIYGRKDVESDFINPQLALKYQDAENIVIGSDLELLALTTNIKAMISPQNRYRGMVLEKAAILHYFDIFTKMRKILRSVLIWNYWL